jgi:succinate-semialdehyde dehydrogenase/glutarate-semialdehyde dehydrogenase
MTPARGIEGHVADAAAGSRSPSVENAWAASATSAPTVLADCTHGMRVMTEETFGPVLAFMKVGDDLDRALELANDTVFGLSAYFFSGDMRNCFLAAQRLEAGSIWINDIHGSFVQAPYGGMKQSGIGREQGSLAIDDYLEWKTVYQEMSYESRGARLCVHR